MSRRDDLEQLIRDLERLILEHEQIIQTTDRPEERLASQRKLQEHRASLERYRAELAALPAETRLARPVGPLPAPPPAPRHAGRLVGRQKELDWLCSRLGQDGTPARVAVRGLGGVGKSELAIAAAHALHDHFEGRVIWLEGGANSVEAIQDRLAAALGVELPPPGDPLRDNTLTWVLSRQKPTLIVLDDLRRAHLDRWPALCPPSPPCAVLITSQRADLPLPPRAVLPLAGLYDTDAVELLAFLLPEGWAEAEPQAAAEIVASLDGIPLALTLAARRAARLARAAHPLATLCDELHTHRERVLNQTDRPERRDLSVFLTFDLSFDDLDAPDRDRLRRLGVFARNRFELPAMAAVWETDEEQARAAANRLTDAGLIEEIEPDEWWMHDLLRAHAADRLRAIPEQYLAAHLAYAVHWQRWLEGFTPRSPDDWQQLNARRPEFEAAVEWLLKGQPDNPATAVRLTLAMIQTFPAFTFPRGVDWLRAALSAAQDRQRAAEQDAERQMWNDMVAQAQSSLATLLSACGQYDEAEWLYRASLPLLARSGDIKNLATTQARLADLLFQIRAQYDEAEWLYRSSLDIMEKLDDTANAAMMQSKLADLLLHVRAQYDEAEQRYRSSLHLFETTQDSRSAAVTRSSLAELLCRRKQYQEAERLYRQSIHTFETIAQPRSLAITQAKLADLLRMQGQYDDAEQLYSTALKVLEDLNDRRSGAIVQLSLADLACARQKCDQAEQLYRLSLEASQALGDRRSAAITRGKLATCLRRCNKLDQAEAEYRSSLHDLKELNLHREAAVTQLNLASLLEARGQCDEAEQLYQQSMSTLKELQDVNAMIAQLSLADMLFKHRRYEEAEALYADGLQSAQQHQDAQYAAIFTNRLAQIRNRPRPTDAGL